MSSDPNQFYEAGSQVTGLPYAVRGSTSGGYYGGDTLYKGPEYEIMTYPLSSIVSSGAANPQYGLVMPPPTAIDAGIMGGRGGSLAYPPHAVVRTSEPINRNVMSPAISYEQNTLPFGSLDAMDIHGQIQQVLDHPINKRIIQQDPIDYNDNPSHLWIYLLAGGSIAFLVLMYFLIIRNKKLRMKLKI